MILTEICQHLRNWFDRNQKKYHGEIRILDGELIIPDSKFTLQDGQYYRIIGSVFNDGVHCYNSESLIDENEFEGSVWSMAIPPALIALASEIEVWQAKYGDVESTAMSPYNSESFGGYSYSKSSGSSASGTAGGASWQSVFANRLNAWRKI